MFVYGRRVQQTRAGDPPHRFAHRLPEEEWEIVVSGVYPAYITEEQYARNREQLRANMYNFIHRHPGAPREARRWSRGWSCVAAVGDACRSNTASRVLVTSVGTTLCAMRLPPANPLANATWMKRCVRAF